MSDQMNDYIRDVTEPSWREQEKKHIDSFMKVLEKIPVRNTTFDGLQTSLHDLEQRFKEREENVADKNERFKTELQSLINRYSMESGSNTPDFILAEYLFNCLQSFDLAYSKRIKWYAADTSIAPET